MKQTRRNFLALGAMAGLAGCESLGVGSDESAQDATTGSGSDGGGTTNSTAQVSEYFDSNGALVAPVDNERTRTRSVSPNVGAGFQLVAFDDDGTATVVEGKTREVLYSGDDIGEIINQMQTDFPRGVHLHLADMFEYSTNIVVTTPMRLTGEQVGVQHQRKNGYGLGPKPTGLRFTGSGKALLFDNPTEPVKNLHVEDLFVHAESGTVALEVFAPDDVEGQDNYSPWPHATFRNVMTRGGSEAGFVVGGTFVSLFDGIQSVESGGTGIDLAGAGLSSFSLLRSKFAEGTGIRIDKCGSSAFDMVYANYAEDDGIVVGPDTDNAHFGMVFAESNGGVGVRLDTTNCDFRQIRGRDNDQRDVVLEEIISTRIGGIQTDHTGIRIEQMAGGTDIGLIKTTRSGIDTSDAVFKGDVSIRTVNNTNEGPSSFNSATVQADQNGRIYWNFDTLFTQPPMLSFGRRGGGIDQVQFQQDDADFYYGAIIDVNDAGGTVDVRAGPNGNTIK